MHSARARDGSCHTTFPEPGPLPPMPAWAKAGANAHERADDLMTAPSAVPDPRDPRGVRFPLAGMLAIAVCAVLAGALVRGDGGMGTRSRHGGVDPARAAAGAGGVHTARVVRPDRRGWVGCRVGGVRVVPGSSRRGPGRRVVAIDGKPGRGTRSSTQPARHLIAGLGPRDLRRGGPARLRRQEQ